MISYKCYSNVSVLIIWSKSSKDLCCDFQVSSYGETVDLTSKNFIAAVKRDGEKGGGDYREAHGCLRKTARSGWGRDRQRQWPRVVKGKEAQRWRNRVAVGGPGAT